MSCPSCCGNGQLPTPARKRLCSAAISNDCKTTAHDLVAPDHAVESQSGTAWLSFCSGWRIQHARIWPGVAVAQDAGGRPVGRHHLRTDACQEFQKMSSLTFLPKRLEAVDCILITAHAMAARAPPRALATEVPDPSGMYTRNYKINNDASFHIIGLAVRKTRSNRPDVSPCSCGSRSAWLPREAIIQPMSAWDKSRIPRRHLWIRHKTNAKTCLFNLNGSTLRKRLALMIISTRSCPATHQHATLTFPADITHDLALSIVLPKLLMPGIGASSNCGP